MNEEQNIPEENNEQNESQYVNPNSETENNLVFESGSCISLER